eukprot:CAMPEP_0170591502 /NCGR_PEP_ID=MMETSP0224-20130122/12438_1 /TAXON_ID=285029 /ORGANISM="Togula jolla, Strain CCCM 725" /LENGTH=295 /DNA_ID=CAMNT_0010915371 /DNA_START=65 /DNA_END=952 /DNA_ORIENTATION=-
MAFANAVRKALSGEARKMSYEDLEGMVVSMGVIFALILPVAMNLQYMVYDDGPQSKNFLMLLCTEKKFRNYVVKVMEDDEWGNIGQYEREFLDWNMPLGEDRTLNMRDVLLTDSYWPEPIGPETIYTCGEKGEVTATAEVIWAHFPDYLMRSYALINSDSVLWSDHISAMAAFTMTILIAGELGSLALYLSLMLSPCREDETGEAVARWANVGYPCLGFLFLTLIVAIIVLLFSQDAYVESNDPFFLRATRFGGYSKIALLAVFVPLVLIFFGGSFASMVRACRPHKKAAVEDET